MKTSLLAVALSVCAAAQIPSEPPVLIRLSRSAARGSGAVLIQQYVTARARVQVLGMYAISGKPETWLVEMHDSFGSIEGLENSVGLGPAPEDSRMAIAHYRPAWSYRPDLAVKLLSKARYFHIATYQVRPGSESDFAEVVKQRRQAFESVNLDRPELAYHVVSGADSGTFLFVAPLTSLRNLDAGMASFEAAGRTGKRSTEVELLSIENLLFRVDPRISYVSDDFSALDPEFWNVRAKTP